MKNKNPSKLRNFCEGLTLVCLGYSISDISNSSFMDSIFPFLSGPFSFRLPFAGYIQRNPAHTAERIPATIWQRQTFWQRSEKPFGGLSGN